MKKIVLMALAACLALGTTGVYASQADDINALRHYFKKKFPTVPFKEFANGSYALSADKRINWESMRDFPPFEDHVAKGEALWNKKFKNGNSFATCLGNDVTKVRNRFPHWNAKDKKVETLEGNIVACQKANGEKPFGLKKGNIAYLSAYIASQANGQKVNVVVPDDKDAQAAYEAGKQFFYAKRGQLNLSCADCHVYSAGMYARGNLLSPVMGHTTHFPVWRGKWAKKKGDGFGTLHRRYGGCNKQVRAKPFKAQGKEYSNMEFFHASMSNGLTIDAPDYRE
ncbi:MAG: sulfur oxidation c-type cytochrome SoxA [Gammaproteobacteria bacterium]|nr:sulfur oxidation c-type cytochrome SoxA [Gammaproteobacteria bacterium]